MQKNFGAVPEEGTAATRAAPVIVFGIRLRSVQPPQTSAPPSYTPLSYLCERKPEDYVSPRRNRFQK